MLNEESSGSADVPNERLKLLRGSERSPLYSNNVHKKNILLMLTKEKSFL